MHSERLERKALCAIDEVFFPKGRDCCFPDVDYGMIQQTTTLMAVARSYFETVPYMIDLVKPAPRDSVLLRKALENADDESEYACLDIAERSKSDNELDVDYFISGLNQHMSENDCYVYNMYDKQMIFTDDCIFFNCKSDAYPITLAISRTPDIDEGVRDLLVRMVSKDENTIKWLSVGPHGSIMTKSMVVRDVDIDGCYNDDFPAERVDALFRSGASELIIFRGNPGTGKSTMIRHLINKYKGMSFYWLDVNMFAHINDNTFQSFLLENRRGVYILEDCESILKSRDTGYNDFLASLLNLSDGMLGDGLSNKFICTFNTDLKNIDGAVLRKGRLKLMYTFEDLAADKCNALFERLGSDYRTDRPMPLCEVFNRDGDNGADCLAPKKVGF